MIACIKNLDEKLKPFWGHFNKGACLSTLAARLYMADVFFKSGMLKLKDTLNGRFDEVVTAFTDFHPIPGVDPVIAAIGGMAGEVILPVLLAFGFLGRFAALGLLVMTLVIQFGVPAEYEIAHHQHYVWMILLSVPLFHGMGRISVDYWLVKWLRKS